jgi:Replication regulatory protein RepB
MAKTNAERQAKRRAELSKDETIARINVIVSASAKSQLERLAARVGVTQREMLERILSDADTLPPSTSQRAAELLARFNGDLKQAKEEYRRELRERYPGFTVCGREPRKSPTHYEARKLYNRMCKQLEALAKTWN